MNLDKKKLVFGMVVLLLILFIGIYCFKLFVEDSKNTETLNQTEVPLLEENQKEYRNRKEAVDQLKEPKSTIVPSIYNESLLNDDGTYDPYLQEKEKIKLMDSILSSGPEPEDFHLELIDDIQGDRKNDLESIISKPKKATVVRIGYGHQAFFESSDPSMIDRHHTDLGMVIRAEVNGDQVVQKDQRLEIRLTENFIHENDTLFKNSILYASCSFKPNRLLLTIFPAGPLKTGFKAYDISDRQEGIYIKNSFHSQARTEVIDDLIQDINITGVPQVSGLKSIFQRSNRNVKVKVFHQYQLYLKLIL